MKYTGLAGETVHGTAMWSAGLMASERGRSQKRRTETCPQKKPGHVALSRAVPHRLYTALAP